MLPVSIYRKNIFLKDLVYEVMYQLHGILKRVQDDRRIDFRVSLWTSSFMDDQDLILPRSRKRSVMERWRWISIRIPSGHFVSEFGPTWTKTRTTSDDRSEILRDQICQIRKNTIRARGRSKGRRAWPKGLFRRLRIWIACEWTTSFVSYFSCQITRCSCLAE